MAPNLFSFPVKGNQCLGRSLANHSNSVFPGGAVIAQPRWMLARGILGSRLTGRVSSQPFLNSCGWWWLISSIFLIRISCHKTTHANGYYGAWLGCASPNITCQTPLSMRILQARRLDPLLQGIFPDPGIELGSPALQRILYQLSYQGSPNISPIWCLPLQYPSPCSYRSE